jgi:L-alanine-DL-glutamate epimerase-like enolase superfamily enzyme
MPSTGPPHRLSRRAALELLGLATGATVVRASVTGGQPTPAPSRRSRIASIDVFPVRYPMAGRFKFFEGPDGSPTGRPAALVRITDDDGVVGWGESVPIPKWSEETLETATTTIVRYLAPELLGRDSADIEGAHAVMDHAIAPSFSTGQPIAKAGIDIALHDLLGKRLAITLPKLWHRTPADSLTLSWTVSPASLEDIEPLVAAGREKGYEHFNVKVGTTPDFDVEVCRRVRALAPRTFLWADANCGYDVETALKVAPRLADAGVDVLEAPIRPNRIQGYQALRRQRALPILMDEGIVSPVELVEFLHLGMLDGVAMKPARCGGLVPALRQIAILLDAGLMWLGSGLTDPDVSLAATMALYTAVGQGRPCALNGPQFLAHSVVERPFVPAAGRLAALTAPGLGVTIVESKVRAIMDRGVAGASSM